MKLKLYSSIGREKPNLVCLQNSADALVNQDVVNSSAVAFERRNVHSAVSSVRPPRPPRSTLDESFLSGHLFFNQIGSPLLPLWQMRVPSPPRFRRNMSEPRPCGRVGNTNQMIAAGTLNLPSGVARIALQRLIAMCTIELEFVRAHNLSLIMHRFKIKASKNSHTLMPG